MLDGKTIIVTGASSGIGAATAKLVAEQGASVISVDIVASTNPVGKFFQADLASQASIDQLVAALPPGCTRPREHRGLAAHPARVRCHQSQSGRPQISHATTCAEVGRWCFHCQSGVTRRAWLAGCERDHHRKRSTWLRRRIVLLRHAQTRRGAKLLLFERSTNRLDNATPLDVALSRHPDELSEPRSCRYADTQGLHRDPWRACRRGHEDNGSPGNAIGYRASSRVPAFRRSTMDQRHECSRRRWHVLGHPVPDARLLARRGPQVKGILTIFALGQSASNVWSTNEQDFDVNQR